TPRGSDGSAPSVAQPRQPPPPGTQKPSPFSAAAQWNSSGHWSALGVHGSAQWFSPDTPTQKPDAHSLPALHASPSPPGAPGPGTQRPPTQVKVSPSDEQSLGRSQAGPMMTSTVPEPGVP